MTAQQLKNSILQMAVQGKLVPQDPNDEPASALLERIKAEKQELIKAGKIKKDKKSSEIFRGASRNLPYAYCEQIGKEIRDISDEIPFDIPDTWEWAKVRDLTELYNGKAFKPSDWSSTGLPIVRIQNLNNEISQYNYYDKPVEEDYRLYGGELLFAWSGTPGTSFGAHIWQNTDAVLNQHIFKLVFNENNLYKKYFMYVLNQRVLTLIGLAHGSAGLQHVTKGVFENTLIPIPPLEEQKRIVSKIEELLPLIDKYGAAETKLSTLNTTFPEALKKSILQEAVQGKLVPQNPDDEPASVLLERIKAEKHKLVKEGKIKKEKPLAPITEEEIPFDIPESWEWCRLKNIVSLLGDGIHGTPEYSETGKYFFINGNNLSEGNIIIKDDTKKVDESQYLKYRKELNDNTVFVSINGTIGNIAFYNNEPVILGKSACYFNLIIKEFKAYMYWLLKTDYFLKYAITNATGSTIKNVSLKTMNDFLVPLPPFEEQKRIVAKIEELMPFIGNITK